AGGARRIPRCLERGPTGGHRRPQSAGLSAATAAPPAPRRQAGLLVHPPGRLTRTDSPAHRAGGDDIVRGRFAPIACAIVPARNAPIPGAARDGSVGPSCRLPSKRLRRATEGGSCVSSAGGSTEPPARSV